MCNSSEGATPITARWMSILWLSRRSLCQTEQKAPHAPKLRAEAAVFWMWSMAGLRTSVHPPGCQSGLPRLRGALPPKSAFSILQRPQHRRVVFWFLLLCKATPWVLMLVGRQSLDVVCRKVLKFRQLQRLRWNPWLSEGTSGCTHGSCFRL